MSKDKILYISDLDGTLLNKSAHLSEYAINSLNAMIENGLNFSVATARLLAPVRKMLMNVKVNVPIILMNGVLIYDINQESYVKVNKLSPEIIITIIETIRQFHITGFMYELKDKELVIYHEIFEKNLLSDYAKDRAYRYNSINGFNVESVNDIIYFTLMDTYECLKPVFDIFSKITGLNQSLYENVYCQDMWYLEVFSDAASKKTAVEFLRDFYGFNYLVCFGDNHNDLPLFEVCDVCVAVKNATSEIKEKANFICESNNDDGVVKWLENNTFNQL